MATPLSHRSNAYFPTAYSSLEARKSSKPIAVALCHRRVIYLRPNISVPCNANTISSSIGHREGGQQDVASSPSVLAANNGQLCQGEGPGMTHEGQMEDVYTSKSRSSTANCSAGRLGRAQRAMSPVLSERRFASLSRVLLVGQPGAVFRTLASRRWPTAVGPLSLLMFLFGTVMALFAAVRGVLVRKVKACRCCKGFGVVRCRLCDGRGSVDWRAKFSYSEMCPLCAAKRFVVCPDCGGHYHRPLFNHAKGAKGTLEAYFPGSAPAMTTRSLD